MMHKHGAVHEPQMDMEDMMEGEGPGEMKPCLDKPRDDRVACEEEMKAMMEKMMAPPPRRKGKK